MATFTTFQYKCIALFVFSGTLDTLILKWISLQYAVGALGKYHKFSHTVFLMWLMFVAEMLCGFIYIGFYYYYKRKGKGEEQTSLATRGTKSFNPLILLPPCILDLVSSAMTTITLHSTYASSLLMFQASEIVFIAILSAAFLHRHFIVSELIAMLLVFIGLFCIGTADCFYTFEKKDYLPFYVVVDDLFMIIDCLVFSILLIYQQKVYFIDLDLPVLLAVGIEGFYGLVIMSILNIGFYFWEVNPVYGQNPRCVVEDFLDAFIQMSNNMGITAGLICNVIIDTLLMTLYSYTQMTIIKELSALTRQVLDKIRIITVWIISVSILNENGLWQKIPGFFVLMYGVFLYHGFSIFGTAIKATANVE